MPTLPSSSAGALSLWEGFNDETSFLPLLLSLTVFTIAYLYSRVKKFDFSRWLSVHNLHNGLAVILGAISLYIQNDHIFSERIPILWSVGYFIIDLIDCVLRSDVQYTFHAVVCLVLGLCNYASPLLRRLRMNSKAAMCEISNPFMHLAKTTRNPIHFALFGIVFTCCRIIWLPIMMLQLRRAGLPWTDARLLGIIAFYGLNVFWYWKIIRIMLAGSAQGEEDKPKKE